MATGEPGDEAFEAPTPEDRRWDRLLSESRKIIESEAAAAHVSASVLTEDLLDTLVRLITAHIRVEVDTMRRDLQEQNQRFAATAIQRIDSLANNLASAPTRSDVTELMSTATGDLRSSVGSVAARLDALRRELQEQNQHFAATAIQRIDSLSDKVASAPTRSDVSELMTTATGDVRSAVGTLAEGLNAVRWDLQELQKHFAVTMQRIDSLGEGLTALRPAVTNADLDVKLSELTRVAQSLHTRSEVEELLSGVKGEVRSAVASLSHDVRSLRSVVDDDDVEGRLSALRQRVESLCTRTEVEDLLAVSTTDVRSTISSMADDLHQEVAALQGELQRLKSRAPSPPQPTILDDSQLDVIAETVKAAMRRPSVRKGEGGASPAGGDVAKAKTQAKAKAKATKTTKAAAARRTAATTAAKGKKRSDASTAEPVKSIKAAKATKAAAASKSARPAKAVGADADELSPPRKALAAKKKAPAATPRGTARPRRTGTSRGRSATSES